MDGIVDDDSNRDGTARGRAHLQRDTYHAHESQGEEGKEIRSHRYDSEPHRAENQTRERAYSAQSLVGGEPIWHRPPAMATEGRQLPAIWMAVVVAILASIVLPLHFGGSGLTQVRALCAVVPALVVLHLFIRSDLFPEPPHLILVTFALGIMVTLPVVFVALFIERLLGGFDSWGSVASPVLRAFAGAALPEETGKFLILTLYCARRSAFDEPMDGLVYGVTASLGFAALENIFYVFDEPDYPGWLAIAGLRAIFAVPAHAIDGAVMGFFIGLGYAIPARRRQLTWAAWGVPVVLHGLYDLGAFIGILPLWLGVFLFQLGLARRMLAKLQAIQTGREHPEAVVQWAWATTRRQLRLSPRALPLPAAAEPQRAAGADAAADTGTAEDSIDADDVPPPPICPRCGCSTAACICSPGHP